MQKLVIASILALFMLGMSAYATETRTLTIGDNNLVVLDEANIWLFPSRINDYPSLAIGEFQNNTDDNFGQFGIHWKFNRENPWVLGTYFDNMGAFQPEDLLGDNLVPFEDTVFVGDDTLLVPLENRRIQLLYGRRLSNLYFGTRLSVIHSSWSFEDATPPYEAKQSLSYYDLGFGLTDGAGQWDVAANVALGTWTDEDATGAAVTEPDGFMDLGLVGRYFYQVNPSYTLVPHASLAYSKRGAKFIDDDQTVDNKTTSFAFGSGLNYTPATNVFAVMDIGLAYAKTSSDESETVGDVTQTDETDRSDLWLPYFRIGLDADVFRWVDVRFGATSTWRRTSDEFTTDIVNTNFKTNFADNETFLGFGFHFGRLHIDTYTDPELFLDGFNFISGGTNDMNFRLSAVYEMM